MFNIRRIPGVLINYRYVTITWIVISFAAVYYLLMWGVMCTNFQTWHHVSKLCQLHRRGEAVGNLCKPLCDEKTIHSLSCHSAQDQQSRGAVFSAEFEGARIVFKAARRPEGDAPDPVYWLEKLGEQRYPTEEEFEAMIREAVATKLNVTISRDQTERLARLGPGAKARDRSMLRGVEMQNLWLLLQDNEYVCTTLFADRDVFPQPVGTCGAYYAVERLDPVRPSTGVLSPTDTHEEWASRVRSGVLVLDLLEELESGLPEPFRLCDVRTSHFGLAANGGRVKFLDPGSALPRSVAGGLVATGRRCVSHGDCDHGDCRSTCNRDTARCDRPVSNDNYQIVCEKVFLGWAMSARVIVPGLLMSRHTPSSLAALLRQCANPDTDSDTPRARPSDDLRRRLYATLSEMDLHLTNELYI